MISGKNASFALGAAFATVLIAFGVFLARSSDPEVETVVRGARDRENRDSDRIVTPLGRAADGTDVVIEDRAPEGEGGFRQGRPPGLNPPRPQGEGIEEIGAGVPGKGTDGPATALGPGAAAVGPDGVRAFGKSGQIAADGKGTGTGSDGASGRSGRTGSGEDADDRGREDSGTRRDANGNIISGSGTTGGGTDDPSATAAPTAVSATATPSSATATPQATSVGTSDATPTPSETPAATATPTETSQVTPSPSATPSPSEEPTPTEEPEPTEEPTPDVTETPEPTPSPSPSPSPSLSPSPSPSPHPGFAAVYLEPGIVQVVPGQEFAVDLFVASQDKAVGGYRAHVLWVPLSLQLVEVLEGSDPYLGFPTDATEGQGFLRLSAIQAQSLTAPVGLLQVVTLRFRSLEAGTERIELVNTGVANTDAQEMVLTVSGDEVQVLSVAPPTQRNGDSDSSSTPAATDPRARGNRRVVPLDSLR